MKPIVLSDHARDSCRERELEIGWIEATVRNPEWRAPDLYRAGVERRFRAIPERGGRILRVACVETETVIRVITAFLDRKARRP